MSRGFMIALLAAVLVLGVGVVGLGVYVFLGPGGAGAARPQSAPPAESAEHGGQEFLKLKNFVTDLADKDRLRYVDVTIAVALNDAAGLEAAKKVELRMRDLVLGHLRSLAAATLAGASGKEKLAEELTRVISPLLQGQPVKVYVTDLVIQ